MLFAAAAAAAPRYRRHACCATPRRLRSPPAACLFFVALAYYRLTSRLPSLYVTAMLPLPRDAACVTGASLLPHVIRAITSQR